MAPVVRDGDGSPLQGHQISLSQGHEGQLSSVCVCGGGLSLKILYVSFHASLYRVLSAPPPLLPWASQWCSLVAITVLLLFYRWSKF